MGSNEKQRGNRLTAVSIDGNSIGVMAAEAVNGKLNVLATKHRELDALLEVIKRLRHPIFMNVNLSWFPEKEKVKALVAEMLEEPVFRNPLIGLLPAEKIGAYEVSGEEGEDAARVRRDALLDSHAPSDPFSYPCTVLFQEFEVSPGHYGTRMWVARLAEIVPQLEILQATGLEVVGLLPAARAAHQLIQRVESDLAGQPVTICHVGKLRTMYSTRLPDDHVLHNPIPVGLARDDVHYFESIKPTVASLISLKERLGSLLLPPETTPSPIGSRWASTPQLDCTRFASQISRYALRAMKANRDTTNGEWPTAGIHYLSGRGSRFPGLDNYMKVRIQGDVRLLERAAIPSVGFAEGVDWEEARDNLLCIGALCEGALGSSEGSVLITGDFKSLGNSGHEKRSFPNLKAGVVYVLEQRP